MLPSYGMDLLRWWRFLLHAVGVSWDRATRVEARDFSCWIRLTVKPRRQATRSAASAGVAMRRPGVPNRVTGKPTPGIGYAPATLAHSETVLRATFRCCLVVPLLLLSAPRPAGQDMVAKV
jgi:hypothetical protein